MDETYVVYMIFGDVGYCEKNSFRADTDKHPIGEGTYTYVRGMAHVVGNALHQYERLGNCDAAGCVVYRTGDESKPLRIEFAGSFHNKHVERAIPEILFAGSDEDAEEYIEKIKNGEQDAGH